MELDPKHDAEKCQKEEVTNTECDDRFGDNSVVLKIISMLEEKSGDHSDKEDDDTPPADRNNDKENGDEGDVVDKFRNIENSGATDCIVEDNGENKGYDSSDKDNQVLKTTSGVQDVGDKSSKKDNDTPQDDPDDKDGSDVERNNSDQNRNSAEDDKAESNIDDGESRDHDSSDEHSDELISKSGVEVVGEKNAKEDDDTLKVVTDDKDGGEQNQECKIPSIAEEKLGDESAKEDDDTLLHDCDNDKEHGDEQDAVDQYRNSNIDECESTDHASSDEHNHEVKTTSGVEEIDNENAKEDDDKPDDKPDNVKKIGDRDVVDNCRNSENSDATDCIVDDDGENKRYDSSDKDNQKLKTTSGMQEVGNRSSKKDNDTSQDDPDDKDGSDERNNSDQNRNSEEDDKADSNIDDGESRDHDSSDEHSKEKSKSGVEVVGDKNAKEDDGTPKVITNDSNKSKNGMEVVGGKNAKEDDTPEVITDDKDGDDEENILDRNKNLEEHDKTDINIDDVDGNRRERQKLDRNKKFALDKKMKARNEMIVALKEQYDNTKAAELEEYGITIEGKPIHIGYVGQNLKEYCVTPSITKQLINAGYLLHLFEQNKVKIPKVPPEKQFLFKDGIQVDFHYVAQHLEEFSVKENHRLMKKLVGSGYGIELLQAGLIKQRAWMLNGSEKGLTVHDLSEMISHQPKILENKNIVLSLLEAGYENKLIEAGCLPRKGRDETITANQQSSETQPKKCKRPQLVLSNESSSLSTAQSTRRTNRSANKSNSCPNSDAVPTANANDHSLKSTTAKSGSKRRCAQKNKVAAGRKAKQRATTINNAEAAGLGASSRSGDVRHEIERSSKKRNRGISSVRNSGVKRVKR